MAGVQTLDASSITTTTINGKEAADLVTANAALGTDNVLLRADGPGYGVQASGITIDDTDNMTGVASVTIAGSGSYTRAIHTDGSVAAEIDATEDTAFLEYPVYIFDIRRTGGGTVSSRDLLSVENDGDKQLSILSNGNTSLHSHSLINVDNVAATTIAGKTAANLVTASSDFPSGATTYAVVCSTGENTVATPATGLKVAYLSTGATDYQTLYNTSSGDYLNLSSHGGIQLTMDANGNPPYPADIRICVGHPGGDSEFSPGDAEALVTITEKYLSGTDNTHHQVKVHDGTLLRLGQFTSTELGNLTSVEEGALAYDTTNSKLRVYTGSGWETVTSS
jgi:hypothetical protein